MSSIEVELVPATVTVAVQIIYAINQANDLVNQKSEKWTLLRKLRDALWLLLFAITMFDRVDLSDSSRVGSIHYLLLISLLTQWIWRTTTLTKNMKNELCWGMYWLHFSWFIHCDFESSRFHCLKLSWLSRLSTVNQFVITMNLANRYVN